MLSARRFHARTGALALFAGLALAGCAAGKEATGSPAEGLAPTGRLAEGWGLVIHWAGTDAWLTDPRDAGLRHALALLPERLLELPDELGAVRAPPGSIEFLCDAFGAPWTLLLDLDAGHDAELPVAVRATWTVHAGSAERAAALESRFKDLIALLALPATSAEDDPELIEVETPKGSFFHGVHAKSGTFVVAWGAPAEHEVELGALGFAPGVQPVCAIDVDVAELLSPLVPLLEQGGPETATVLKQFQAMGLLGHDALGFSYASGNGADRAHYLGRYRNWVTMQRDSGGLVETPIPLAELRLVPSDATLASLARFEATAITHVFQAFGPEVEAEAREHVREALGLDLDADVLQPLGQTIGMYMSETTGGGGLASAVAFVALDDEARIAATLERITQHLNGFAAAALKGYVRVRSFEHEGAHCLALTFPGLPVPLEPVLAIHAGHLFAAATPQALFAALAQAGGKGAGLLAHEGLAELAVGPFDDLQSLTFSDAPRLARDGYGLLGLGTAMLANAVRSKDGAREPGLVLPSYHDLLAGARPSLMVQRISGSDLVLNGQGDRSALLQFSAMLGWAPAIVAGIGAMGSLAALTERSTVHRLESAQERKARADIEVIDAALEEYAIENGGDYPTSLEVLVKPDENGARYLDMERLPVDPWGNPYVYELDEEGFTITSYGADGMPGGEGQNADITNAGEEEEESDEGSGPFIYNIY